MCDPSHTVLSMRRPTSVTSWASAQMCPSPPTSAPQVRPEADVKLYDVQLPGCVDLSSFFPAEFSVLVDVSEGSCQNSAVGNDDVSSLYQFTISSANTQPADRGETPRLYLSRRQISFTGLKGNKGIPASAERVVFSTGAFVLNLNYSKYIISLY